VPDLQKDSSGKATRMVPWLWRPQNYI